MVLVQYATACRGNLDTQMCDSGNKDEKLMTPVLTSRVNELTCKLLTISEAFWSNWVNCALINSNFQLDEYRQFYSKLHLLF